MLVHDSVPTPEHGETPGYALFDATAKTQQLEHELLEKVFGLDTLLEDGQRTEISRTAVSDLSPRELETYLDQEDELEGRIVQDTEFALFLAEQPGYKVFSARRYLTDLAFSSVDEDGLHGFRIMQTDPGRIEFMRHVPSNFESGQMVQSTESMQTITLEADGESVKTTKKTSYFSPWLEMPIPIEDKDNPPAEDIDVRVAIEKVHKINEFLEDLKHRDTKDLKADVEKHLFS